MKEPLILGRRHGGAETDESGAQPPFFVFQPRHHAQADTRAYATDGRQDSLVFDDLDWNAMLDEVGLTRFGISPAEVAYRWQAKQDAERLAAECREYDRQWACLEACQECPSGPEPPPVEVVRTSSWKPMIETDIKKAAKWRARLRRSSEGEHSTCGDRDGKSPGSLDVPIPLACATSQAPEDSGSCPRPGRTRPFRASRKSKVLDIYTMNTSGKPAAITALRELAPVRRSVAVVAFQEHHCLADALPDFQHQAGQVGWNLAAFPATVKKEGPSAGVALATPKHIPAATSGLVQVDLSPSASPGRLGSLWVQAGIPGGMLVLSAYLWHSEGMPTRNQEIVFATLAAAKAYGGPWLLVGDFNHAPAALEHSMAAALKAAGATVISTHTPTHFPGGGLTPSFLDYAIVDDRLANGKVLKHIEVNSVLSIGKHRAVQIGVSNKGHVAYVTMALKPRSFPAAVPVGCARRPVDSPAPLADVGIDRFYADTLACAEAETGRRHDLVDESGGLRKEFAGRHRGFRTKQRLPFPPRTCSEQGEAGTEAYILRWIHERIVEPQHCAQVQIGGPLTVSSLRQTMGILERFRKLLKDAGRMEVLCGCDSRWRSWLLEILSWGIEGPPEVLAVPATEAFEQGKSAATKHLAAAKVRWKSWVEDKLRGGAPSLHQFVKRTTESPLGSAGPLDQRDVSPQAVLLRDHAVWAEVWTRLSGKFDCPWAEGELQPCESLEPITRDHVRVAAMTFSMRTAVGEDWIRPREVGMLSDRLLDRYAAVMNSAEACGCWPKFVSTN